MNDDVKMEHADSRMMKYPDIVHSNEAFESEDSTDWDRAFILAQHLMERGYPVPDVDRYALAGHILKKWKEDAEAANATVEKIDNWNI